MIDHHGESVDDAAKEPPKAPKKKKKRLVTDKMIAANRRNSTSSTGPSEAARERTRFNGVATAWRAVRLCSSMARTPQEFWDEVDLWCKRARGQDGRRTHRHRQRCVQRLGQGPRHQCPGPRV